MAARTRKTSIEILEGKIEKGKENVIEAKRRYEEASKQLEQLMEKRDAMRNEELLRAVAKSSRTYEEIIAFVNGTGTLEDK